MKSTFLKDGLHDGTYGGNMGFQSQGPLFIEKVSTLSELIEKTRLPIDKWSKIPSNLVYVLTRKILFNSLAPF